MNNKISKTINLIKKSYNQPLVFHALCNHLCYIMEGANPIYEIKDEWSKILIYSVVQNNIPNQGLESKIVSLLRTLKKEKNNKATRLKIMIIAWYLKNRNVGSVNNIILFELVNSFLGISEYIDGLIISILNSTVNASQLGCKANKKFRNESLEQMVKKIRASNIDDTCKILALPLYTQYDVEPVLGEVDIQNTLDNFFLFECVCYYAKYCKNESYVRNLIPQNEIFIANLSRFIQKNFEIEATSQTTELCLEDREIYKLILEAYEIAPDKNKFKSNLLEYISSLK
ncbi:hypothetical protein NGRA_0366 [Nosema granulosis]|uniref:Uncharacterized protein n=1 Tax=Nosema granulosis TaxID=83296 RepID=A0A9P6L072_9MICR|nr:hypothetical protein NGRA_0366 [Nosema granulosis]